MLSSPVAHCLRLTATPLLPSVDVWAPEIATHYGEVFWTDQGSTPLPPDIVKRFDGKVIAIQVNSWQARRLGARPAR